MQSPRHFHTSDGTSASSSYSYKQDPLGEDFKKKARKTLFEKSITAKLMIQFLWND
jgi:hypothetical protein